MKRISTQEAILLEAFDDKPAEFKAETYQKIIKPFEENKLRIIETASLIEEHLERIITFYFFGRTIPENKIKSEKFQSFILSSDWCSFSSKRKLILHIINEEKLLQGSEKNDFENLLRKTMSYRNAFTHGTMATNGEIIRLKYYEGSTKIKNIDDDYLTEIENDLNRTFDLTMDLSIRIGSTILHDSQQNAL